MSYVALATDQFDELTLFYGDRLRFPIIAGWDRANARGRRYDLGGGLRLEIFDNMRERQPLDLGRPGDRMHIVIEVDDVEAAWHKHAAGTPEPQAVSWGARLFQLRDPDGVPVTFLQWT